MTAEKFAAIMGVLVPQVVEEIAKKYGIDEITASKNFYSSEVYTMLEDEATKLWHFSPLTLFNMYDKELKTGTFEPPVEG